MGPHVRNKTMNESPKTVLKLAFENVNMKKQTQKLRHKQIVSKMNFKEESESLVIETKSPSNTQ